MVSLGLFDTIGYRSERRMKLRSSDASGFLGSFDRGNTLNRERALVADWQRVEFLFQLTDAEVQSVATGTDELAFESKGQFDGAQINSFLFLAHELKPRAYTRTELAGITRAINRLFDMPVLMVFKHGDTVSIGIIHRRLSKRDQSKDVLEKVTLIKDIAFADPVRAHVEILHDFALPQLFADYGVHNFVALHAAWQKRLGSYALSNDFYREIADWYFWAHHQVEDGAIQLPRHCDTEQEKSLFLIRMLTRIIFSWFLVEKRLIPTDLFREHSLRKLLKDLSPNAPTYYRAILQNLFFGTLNMPSEQRAFREKKKEGERYDQNYGITNLWRYETAFQNRTDWESIATRIPFLNGGLFDCLDDKSGKKKDNFILDGFSDRDDFGCHLPNDLFFGPERTVDLSKDYGEEDKRTARSKRAKVRGLIEILSRYKFTIEENTPLEEEIALDPELLGKVFENLLASYNEDTKTTARKALGAFYTPREIVSYMVDEALKSYLATQVPRCKGALEDLFSNKATLKEIKSNTRDALIAAIGRVKILDPACGSGAFPMGALHRLVDLLQKLDPNNESWKRDRLAEARRYRELLQESGASKDELAACDARIAEIEKSFDTRYHALDFARKLYLIENSIYGVDIQPIATQIAKLRFFISLVVDQKVEPKAPNLGVRPLPNLETRLVSADSLTPIEKAESDLFSGEIDQLRAELAGIRHEHFNARSPAAKRKWRDADAAKRQEIAALLEREHAIPRDSARKLAAWDPYDQNVFAPFFDSEWMFGRNEAEANLTAEARKEAVGFDIVIGNPPYVRQEQIKHLKEQFKKHYECFTGTADLYVYFYEAGIKLLRSGGTFSFITSNKWFRAGYGEKLRGWLTQKTRILQLIDFGDAPVFTAIAYPCIVIAQRTSTPVEAGANVRTFTWELGPAIETFAEVFARKSFAIAQHELKPDGWRLETATNLRLLDRLRKAGKPLGEYVNGRFYRGVLTGLNEAFVVDRATRDRLIAEHKSSDEILKPFLRGRDVKRWRVDYSDQYLIKIESSENVQHPWSGKGEKEAERIFAKTYPAIHAFFGSMREALVKRYDQGQYFWELRSCAYWQDFGQPKVLYPDIYEHQSFMWDEEGLFAANTCYFIPTSEKWFTGLLNSTAVEWFYGNISNRVRGGYLRAFSDYMKVIPIPSATGAQQKTIEGFVDYLLWLNRHLADHPEAAGTRDPLMVAFWEQVLNGLVYELYFSEELHAAGLRLFDLVATTRLPDITKLPEKDRLAKLRAKFEELHDADHPLTVALQKLQTLETIRIIEGTESGSAKKQSKPLASATPAPATDDDDPPPFA